MLFETLVQRGVGFIIMASIVYLLLRLLVFRPKSDKRTAAMTSKDFEEEIFRLNEHCTELSMKLFKTFLEKYRVSNPLAFTVKEKGELKSLFYDVIVPEGDVAIATKERFRNYLREIGVEDMNIRPRYHECTLPLTGKQLTKEDYLSNYADIKIGECLKKGLDPKQYYVLDGAVLKDGDKTKSYSHIIVGDSGTFVVSTRDLGSDVHDTGIDPTEVFIDKDDKWSVKKKDNEIELSSPTAEVLEGKSFMENLMGDMLLEVHPVVVFPDEQLTVHQEDELPYKVIGTRNLCSYIKDYPSKMSVKDRTEIISRLNSLIME